MTCPSGMGRSAPLVRMPARVVPGGLSSSPRPANSASSLPSGRRASIASAPASIVTPATSVAWSLPPTRGAPSRTVTLRCSPRCRRCHAAARPAIPPPTTTTCLRLPSMTPDRIAPSFRPRIPPCASGAP